MNVLVVGLGFVGLSTALVLCEKETVDAVWGIDRRCDLLKQNKAPFYEPGIDEKLEEHRNHKFFVAGAYEEIRHHAIDVVFFCVGTPQAPSGACDYSVLEDAVRECVAGLGRRMYRTYVVKSSIPPGSMREVLAPLFCSVYSDCGTGYDLVYNPEFLRESHAWEDARHPDRVVIGTDSARAEKTMRELYSDTEEAKFVMTSPTTAEFIKYLSNAFLASVISFSNDMAMLGKAIGDIEISKAFQSIYLDKRWRGDPCPMTAYLYPGCGFGGYCLPKDVSALYHSGKRRGYDSDFLRSIMTVNRDACRALAEEICSRCSPKESIGILGLSFKPGSDDVRESPAGYVIRELLSKGYRNIKAYDPMAMEHFAALYGFDIQYGNSLDDMISSCEALVLVTAWPEFIAAAPKMKGKKKIDGRYCLSGGE